MNVPRCFLRKIQLFHPSQLRWWPRVALCSAVLLHHIVDDFYKKKKRRRRKKENVTTVTDVKVRLVRMSALRIINTNTWSQVIQLLNGACLTGDINKTQACTVTF